MRTFGAVKTSRGNSGSTTRCGASSSSSPMAAAAQARVSREERRRFRNKIKGVGRRLYRARASASWRAGHGRERRGVRGRDSLSWSPARAEGKGRARRAGPACRPGERWEGASGWAERKKNWAGGGGGKKREEKVGPGRKGRERGKRFSFFFQKNSTHSTLNLNARIQIQTEQQTIKQCIAA